MFDSTGALRRRDGDLGDLVLYTKAVEDLLDKVVRSAVIAASGGVCAGLALARDGHLSTIASSDARAAQYDELQFTCDDGPCLAVMRERKVVLVEDLSGDQLFNRYRPLALALGVRSCVSLPLISKNRCLGALTVYSHRVNTFSPSEVAGVRAVADEASKALTLALDSAEHLEFSAPQRSALTSQVVGQATGIIMSEYGCDAHTAAALLGDASRDRTITLNAVAVEVTASMTATPRRSPLARGGD